MTRYTFLFFFSALPALLCAQTEDRAAAEKQFEESLANVTLVGQSTRDGSPGVSDDRYSIQKVVKQSGDTWVFHTRIKHGEQEITVPMPLSVKWAGDTPVITLTDQPLPGRGTYTARVVIYRGHYAGTWSGKNGGGKVFGKIVKGEAK